MVFDRKTMVIPNETVNENSHMQVSGDIILDDRSVVDYTLATEKRIFIGEWVKVHGDMSALDDIRIDKYSEIQGDITGGNDIYLGERVKVAGKLTVGKDLDVGSDVAIENGFDAKGWINIRNPIPLIIYFFIYLFNLIKRGRSEEVERILREIDIEDPSAEDILISENFLYIPSDTVVDPDAIEIKGNCRIGNKCKLKGNYKVSGDVKLGDETEFNGKIDAEGTITIGDSVIVNGSLETEGHVIIGQGTKITGDIFCKTLEMVQNTVIEGVIHSPDGIKIIPVDAEEMEKKIRKCDTGLDGLDEIL